MLQEDLGLVSVELFFLRRTPPVIAVVCTVLTSRLSTRPLGDASTMRRLEMTMGCVRTGELGLS